MNILNAIPHMRNTFKGVSPLVIGIPLVPNPENTLDRDILGHILAAAGKALIS
jgi:hypothetical protein